MNLIFMERLLSYPGNKIIRFEKHRPVVRVCVYMWGGGGGLKMLAY